MWKTEKKQQAFDSWSWDRCSSDEKEWFSYLMFLQSALVFLGLGLRKLKIIMDFPLLWALRISPFSWFFYQQEKAYRHSFCQQSVALPSFCAGLWVKANWLWKGKTQIQAALEGRTPGDSSLVWWYLGFWSSSVLLLPFTFHSLKIAAQCILYEVCSWIQWER